MERVLKPAASRRTENHVKTSSVHKHVHVCMHVCVCVCVWVCDFDFVLHQYALFLKPYHM